MNGNSYENDCKNDTHISRIPTLLNGQVCIENKDESKQDESDNKGCIQLLLREATRKLIVKKNSFSNSGEHKVLLIGAAICVAVQST